MKELLIKYEITEEEFETICLRFPCCKDALSRDGLSKLFQEYPDKASILLNLGVESREKPISLYNILLLDALQLGLFPGTVPSLEKPTGYKNIQKQRLRAQHILKLMNGEQKLHSISENDLWWWHLQLNHEYPSFENQTKLSRSEYEAKKEEFNFTKQTIDLATLKNLRTMLWNVYDENHYAAPNFDIKWRNALVYDDWSDLSHPLNKFLLQNLKHPQFYQYWHRLDRLKHLSSHTKEYIRKQIRYQDKKKNAKNQKAKSIAHNPAPSIQERKQYACCFDARIAKDIQRLMSAQPKYWHLWLKQGRKIHTKMTVKQALKWGFLPKTVPLKQVTYNTMKTHRDKAKLWSTLIPETVLVANVTEHLLWWMHINIVFRKRHSPLDEGDLKRFRTMIYKLQCKMNLQRRVLPIFDWNWRRRTKRNSWTKFKIDEFLWEHRRDKRLKPYWKGLPKRIPTKNKKSSKKR